MNDVWQHCVSLMNFHQNILVGDTPAQDVLFPEFPLIPASKGFCLTLRKSLAEFKEVMSSSNIFVS